jgi:hypothetical protein
MKTIVYTGTKSHPESFRLAPHPRLFKGQPLEVDPKVATVLLKCDGVEAAPKPKAEG